MEQETLADHLRRATRNFTSRLPEDRVFAIGHALAAELAALTRSSLRAIPTWTPKPSR